MALLFSLQGFLLFSFSLLRSDGDIMIGLPVVQHVIKLALSVQLLPSHVLVAELAHLLEQFIQLFALIPVHVHCVDENVVLEELKT